MLNKYVYEKVDINKNYYLVKIEQQCIPEITSFVAKKYYSQKHFSFDCSIEELIKIMSENDHILSSYTTTFCLMSVENGLCCTGRLIKREKRLPFEEEFDVDLDLFTDKVKNIYEFARFASNGKVSFFMIERMLKYMLQSIAADAMVVAGLDKKVFKQFLKIKYPIYKLGYPLQYLGSLTVPVGIKLSELSFWSKRKILENTLC
ncbi:hypothetical protein C1468_14520 [Listeria monocytogenes]|nr:hypothetical protein [Listeria monocytogenes]EHT9032834.1 hypothetical protein [Listeria monocytogenes]MCN75685.1 hypothetical protein [Listeria monocytogenes]MCN75845.1 hypothetical protein [Listeria monocytogenes]